MDSSVAIDKGDSQDSKSDLHLFDRRVFAVVVKIKSEDVDWPSA